MHHPVDLRHDLQRTAASTWLRLALVAILLGAFALRLHELTRQDIWWDEARNIDVALRPFLQIATAPELDIQPPFYYWLLHVWSWFFGVAAGQPPAMLAFFVRLLSVFAGVMSVALLMAFGRRVGGATVGLLAALIGALSPFWLGESQETRMYTAGFALLTAAAVLFCDQLERREYPRHGEQDDTAHETNGRRAGDAAATNVHHRLFSRQSLLFVLLSAAALLTHYNAVFVLVAWYAWWGVWSLTRPDRWRELGAVFAHGLLMSLLVLPIAPIALRQIPGYENPNIAVVGAGEYLRQNWHAYLGGYAYEPALLGGSGDLWLWGVLVVAVLGLIAGATRGALRGTKARQSPISNPMISLSSHLLFTLSWLLGGLALYYVAVLDRNAFNVRYASFVTPALYTLIAAGLAGFGRWWKPLPYLLMMGVIVGLAQAAYADLYDRRFDREHIAATTQWLRANTAPGDIIFVDQKYPFGFYYQPYSVDVEAVPPVADTAPARYLFVDINTIDQQMSEWAGGARRIFWVQWFESDTDPRRSVHFLLDKYGRHSGEQWFQGYAIDWWELTPPTQFELAPAMQPLVHQFDQAVRVVEASAPTAPLAAGDSLPVVLRWQRVPDGASPRPLKARVALYDEAGNRLAQADERLLNDRHLAPGQWQPEDSPLGVYLLAVPEDLAPGRYTLRVLVYDADTLEPLTWIDAAGNPAGIEPALGVVEIGK
ncbi:MAG: glycosyltransferase family 39 protein [Caldilinea sp.]